MKVFHIEEFWGDMQDRVAGMLSVTHNNYYDDIYVKMTPEGNGYRINDTNGYTYTGITVYGDSSGYLDTVICNEYGMIPKTANGSGSTYYCDCFYYTANPYNQGLHYLILGNSKSTHSTDIGVFMIRIDLYPSRYGWNLGCGLSCEQPKIEEDGE